MDKRRTFLYCFDTKKDKILDNHLIYGLLTHISDDPVCMAISLIDAIKMRSPDVVLASKRMMNTTQRQDYLALYQEKLWQIKLMLGANRKLAIKKAKDSTVQFIQRQFG